MLFWLYVQKWGEMPISYNVAPFISFVFCAPTVSKLGFSGHFVFLTSIFLGKLMFPQPEIAFSSFVHTKSPSCIVLIRCKYKPVSCTCYRIWMSLVDKKKEELVMIVVMLLEKRRKKKDPEPREGTQRFPECCVPGSTKSRAPHKWHVPGPPKLSHSRWENQGSWRLIRPKCYY